MVHSAVSINDELAQGGSLNVNSVESIQHQVSETLAFYRRQMKAMRQT